MHPNTAPPAAAPRPYTSRGFLLASLIIANLFAIAAFIFWGGSILQALWIYWLQSVIIGAVNVVRILGLPNFADMRTKDGTPLAPTTAMTISRGLKSFLAFFFTLHYGMFHLGYAFVLTLLATPSFKVIIGDTTSSISLGEPGLSVATILLSGLAFAIHHTSSFIAERAAAYPPQRSPIFSYMVVMIRPYARIIPMHIIIIIGPLIAIAFGNTGVFVVFMIIKTLADAFLFDRGVGHIKRAA